MRARAMRCAAALDDLQLGDDRGSDTVDRLQPGGRRGDHAVEIAEGLDQAAGQRFHVLTGNGAEQDQLQHLVIGHGGGAALHEAVAQPCPVIGQIGGSSLGGRHHVIRGGAEQGQGHFAKGTIRVHVRNMNSNR